MQYQLLRRREFFSTSIISWLIKAHKKGGGNKNVPIPVFSLLRFSMNFSTKSKIRCFITCFRHKKRRYLLNRYTAYAFLTAFIFLLTKKKLAPKFVRLLPVLSLCTALRDLLLYHLPRVHIMRHKVYNLREVLLFS